MLIGEDYYHPQNKGKYGTQNLFTKENGRKLGEIYPDFISRSERYRIIGDAKYKPIKNIGNRDYLQVLAYMFRFNSKKGYYFYPDSKHVKKQVLFLNQGLSYEKNEREREDVNLIKLGLHIPKSSERYGDFIKKMKQAEQLFLSELN
ncbi:5-methylcytosine-specific restriction endonuclease McrBC regulatory subunit McrC [Staphylococcus hominis]